jgi:hypothetical protein
MKDTFGRSGTTGDGGYRAFRTAVQNHHPGRPVGDAGTGGQPTRPTQPTGVRGGGPIHGTPDAIGKGEVVGDDQEGIFPKTHGPK